YSAIPPGMREITTIEATELGNVSGGFDWGRTGRAAADGAAYPFRLGKALGERAFGESVGPYVGGTVGAAATLTGVIPAATALLNVGIESAFQGIGIPEVPLDNAAVRKYQGLK